MARYPDAVWRPLSARSFARMTTPVRINLHTAVSGSASLHGFFNKAGRVASHFYVREDGVVEQYVDTAQRAACDLDGNPDTISIETWDGYPSGWKNSSDVPAWTPAQARSLAALVRWLLATHPTIPAKLAQSNRKGRDSHGVSWHRLGVVGAPGFVPRPAGLQYSSARGKVCPGARRMAQIPAIFAAATSAVASPGLSNTGHNNAPNQSPEEDIMATKEELAQIVHDQVKGVLLHIISVEKRFGEYVDEDGKGRDFRTLSDYWLATHSNAVQANRTLAALAATSGVDEKVVIAGVVAGLKPVIEGALEDTGSKIPVDAFLDALAKRLEA